MQIQICMYEFSSDEQSKKAQNHRRKRTYNIFFFSFLKPNNCKQDMLPLENDRVIQ